MSDIQTLFKINDPQISSETEREISCELLDFIIKFQLTPLRLIKPGQTKFYDLASERLYDLFKNPKGRRSLGLHSHTGLCYEDMYLRIGDCEYGYVLKNLLDFKSEILQLSKKTEIHIFILGILDLLIAYYYNLDVEFRRNLNEIDPEPLDQGTNPTYRYINGGWES